MTMRTTVTVPWPPPPATPVHYAPSPEQRNRAALRNWIAEHAEPTSGLSTVGPTVAGIDELADLLRRAGWTSAALADVTAAHLRTWRHDGFSQHYRWSTLVTLAQLTPDQFWPLSGLTEVLGDHQITQDHLQAAAAGVPAQALRLIAQTLLDRHGDGPLQPHALGYKERVWRWPIEAWDDLVRARPTDTEADLVRWMKIAMRHSVNVKGFLRCPHLVTEGWAGVEFAAWFCDAGYSPAEALAMLADHDGVERRAAMMRRVVAAAALR